MMKRKITAALVIAAVIISSIALSFTAFASSQELILGVKASTVMSGVDDLEWFYFTPDQSGTYSFMSFNVPKCDGYLFVKEVDPETKRKEYKQLAYAGPESESHYKEFGRNGYQFCLTYHLEAGKRYYFAAGWYLSTQTRQQFNVMLICDSYDENAISGIEILEAPELNAYSGGNWRKDKNGIEYYHYDLTRIISNTKIKLNYTDGSSTIASGSDEIDGFKINFIDNQIENHWYIKSDPDYNGNKLTIQILDFSVETNVDIVIGNRYVLYGKVVNMAGEPVEKACVSIDGIKEYTRADGSFAVYSSAGYRTISITTKTSIDLNKNIIISAGTNDFREAPFVICNCDYVKDGYINAKDYSYIIKNYSEDEAEKIDAEFKKCINFSAEKYTK